MEQPQLANLLGALSLALTDAQIAALGEATGIGKSGAAAITTLGPHSGLGIDALSEVLGLSHSASVRVADRLVAEGLVRRKEGVDRRHVRVELTGSGTRLRRRLVRARQGVFEAALAHVPTRDRAALARIATRILEGLTTSRGRADHLCRLCDEAVCRPETCPVEQRAIRLESS